MEHKSVKSERGTTYYWINRNVDKNARCIVFTHGLTANHMMFEKQVEYFSKKYSVITWDVPLHGESRPYTDFSYENTAIELKAILYAEKIKHVELMAKSFTDKMLRNSMAKSVSKIKYAYDIMLKMLEPLSKNDIVEQMV
ncbi:hypothetical protein SH2C18_46270 [Clostridium sediminicola]|uniref:alpha/beta fold hydrolase n=1 Tax=Clostridium sediminicola TaxID=3114879 RepID=UPI0031F1D969